MLKNFVLETANAPGAASTVNLAGAATGRQSFAQAFATGAVVYYFMDDGAQAEWGTGTFTAGSPNTLTRATVIGNTSGTTARLNFAGAVRVYNEMPAESVGAPLAADCASTALTFGVIATLGSITLTPGKWDVWGQITFVPSASSVLSQIQAAVSNATGIIPSRTQGATQWLQATFATGGEQIMQTGTAEFTVTTNTPVYLLTEAEWTGGTGVNASGWIVARQHL